MYYTGICSGRHMFTWLCPAHFNIRISTTNMPPIVCCIELHFVWIYLFHWIHDSLWFTWQLVYLYVTEFNYLTFQFGDLMPSMLMMAGMGRNYLAIYGFNITASSVKRYASYVPIRSKDMFLEYLSEPGSLAYAVFVCMIAAIGISGA